MRTLLILLFVFFVLFGVGMAVQPAPEKQPEKVIGDNPQFPAFGAPKENRPSLLAPALYLFNDRNNQVATFTAQSNGAGLWLTHKTGPMIAIYTIDGQAAIGLYSSSKGDSAMPLALLLDKEGAPFIQVRNPKNGEVKHIDLLKLPGTVVIPGK